MWFILFKTLEGIPYYGDDPDCPDDAERDPRIEKYNFWIERELWDEFEDDFIVPMDKLCGAIFDFGDYDYFNVEKCVKMKVWLEARLKKNVPSAFEPVYRKLLEFAEKAIGYNTGVGIEL